MATVECSSGANHATIVKDYARVIYKQLLTIKTTPCSSVLTTRIGSRCQNGVQAERQCRVAAICLGPAAVETIGKLVGECNILGEYLVNFTGECLAG